MINRIRCRSFSNEIVTYFGIILVLIGTISSGNAASYPWVPMSSGDLRIIVDPKVEAEFRLKLVVKARRTIDIVTYDQRSDAIVGMPLLKALREAADRGVKVRFLTSWSAHFFKDLFNRAGRYLLNPPTKTPIDFHIVGGPSMDYYGWKALDGIHEKLFVVDGEWTLVTGRGHGSEYLHWIDTGFAFKGPLVSQAVEGFQKIWDTLVREKFINPLAHSNASVISGPELEQGDQVEDLEAEKNLELSELNLSELESLSEWIEIPGVKLPASVGDHPRDDQPKDVYFARLIHFDLLDQLRAAADRDGRYPYSYKDKERIEVLEDPIVKRAVEYLTDAKTKDFDFYTLSTTLNPKLKSAISSAAGNGVRVGVFTNGEEAQRSIVPIPVPFGWYAGLGDLEEILKAGAKVFAYVKGEDDIANFVHRKLAITGNSVIFGSHNLNLSSSVESDEMSFEVVGAQFATKARQLYSENCQFNAEELDLARIDQERKSTGFDEWMSSFLSEMY